MFGDAERGGLAAQQAENELEQLQQQAYAAGMQAGKEESVTEFASLAQALVSAAQNFQSELASIRESMQHETIGLSMAIARQVVMRELSTQPDAIGDILRQLLGDAEGRNVLAVRLHPEDAARLAALPMAEILTQAEIQIRHDADLTPGGCIVETGFGKLDARVETRLAEMAAVLLGTDARTDIEAFARGQHPATEETAQEPAAEPADEPAHEPAENAIDKAPEEMAAEATEETTATDPAPDTETQTEA